MTNSTKSDAVLLKSYKLVDVPVQKKPLIALSEQDTIQKAFEVLNTNKIASVPVFELRPDGQRCYKYFIDMFDLMYFVAFNKDGHKPEQLMQGQIAKAAGHSIESSRLSLFLNNEPLEHAALVFSSGIHRALIADVESLVSQTDLLKFLLVKQSEWSPKMSNIVAADIFHGKPLTVQDSTYASTAYKKMFIHKVHAVACIGQNGKLAGSLSTSDLKGLKPETLEWLQQPVLLFLSKVHGDRVPEPIVVHSAVSVQQIMEKMVNFKTHRVWVVDGRDQPIGVITMTDIVRVFLEWE